MTVNEIITQLYEDGTVRKLIHTVLRHSRNYGIDAGEDLEQDIYLIMLEKGELVKELYEKKELNFYLTRIIENNIISTTSPYYTKYIKLRKLSNEVQDKDIQDSKRL